MTAPTRTSAAAGLCTRVLGRARGPARSTLARSVALLAFGTCIMHARVASADVSSWLSAGGGYGMHHNESTRSYDGAAGASFALGVGTDPLRSSVVGGVFRSTTYFSLGTDVGIAARGATGGFARGQWGLAIDVGPMWRTWGDGNYGRFPLGGMLILGAPWGLQLGLGGEFWSLSGEPYARGAVAVLEIDLLRLTVMRHGATDRYWENPSPAGGTGGGPAGGR